MKIGILSRKAALYSTSRLVEAAKERGHDVRVIDYSRCFMKISANNPEVRYGGESLEFDVVIPRIGASMTFYGTAVMRQFEMRGTYTPNSSQAISRSRDKLRALQILAREGVGMPVTGFARSTKDIDGLIESVGGAPLVVKFLEGTQGVGVVLTETHKAAESVISAFRQLDANILVQEFVKEAGGADIRAFVIGERVVAAMLRQGPEGDFRSNLHRGGTASLVKLSPEERNTAVRSAKALGLKIAGVDMLRSNSGPVVMEVNSSPGLEGIEKATDKNVAASIIEFIEKHGAKGSKKDRIEA